MKRLKLLVFILFAGVPFLAGCGLSGQSSLTFEGRGLGGKLLAPVVVKTFGGPCPSDADFETRQAAEEIHQEPFESSTERVPLPGVRGVMVPKIKSATRSSVYVGQECGPPK